MFRYLLALTIFIQGCLTNNNRDLEPIDISPDQKLAKLSQNKTLRRMAFGSCNDQDKDPAPWQVIAKQNPELWLWLGDSVYTDKASPRALSHAYHSQLKTPEYRQFTKKTPVIGIWDDHDYAYNNAGQEVPYKDISQKLFLDFLGEPEQSSRRHQKGIYTSYTIGHDEDKTVKVILLDTRYHADHKDYTGDLLGEEQWLWLEKQLSSSRAQFHIIASGIQILPTQHRFEKWANFPKARLRLLELLKTTRPNGLILLSGDRHIAEVSQLRLNNPTSILTEITSSGLTHSYSAFTGEDNDLRVGEVVSDINFGWINFDWHSKPALATIQIMDRSGQPKLAVGVRSNDDQ